MAHFTITNYKLVYQWCTRSLINISQKIMCLVSTNQKKNRLFFFKNSSIVILKQSFKSNLQTDN